MEKDELLVITAELERVERLIQTGERKLVELEASADPEAPPAAKRKTRTDPGRDGQPVNSQTRVADAELRKHYERKLDLEEKLTNLKHSMKKKAKRNTAKDKSFARRIPAPVVIGLAARRIITDLAVHTSDVEMGDADVDNTAEASSSITAVQKAVAATEGGLSKPGTSNAKASSKSDREARKLHTEAPGQRLGARTTKEGRKTFAVRPDDDNEPAASGDSNGSTLATKTTPSYDSLVRTPSMRCTVAAMAASFSEKYVVYFEWRRLAMNALDNLQVQAVATYGAKGAPNDSIMHETMSAKRIAIARFEMILEEIAKHLGTTDEDHVAANDPLFATRSSTEATSTPVRPVSGRPLPPILADFRANDQTDAAAFATRQQRIIRALKALRDDFQVGSVGPIKDMVVFDILSFLRSPIRTTIQPNAIALLGDSGTGKSTLCQAIADVYAAAGLYVFGTMEVVLGARMLGSYLNWSAPLVEQRMASSLEGILFIDEAYTMAIREAGREDKFSGSSEEAMASMILHMSTYPGKQVIIFAGYADKMQNDLFQLNSGLLGRIRLTHTLANYGPYEMTVIVSQTLARDRGPLGGTENLEREAAEAKVSWLASRMQHTAGGVTLDRTEERSLHQAYAHAIDRRDEAAKLGLYRMNAEAVEYLANVIFSMLYGLFPSGTPSSTAAAQQHLNKPSSYVWSRVDGQQVPTLDELKRAEISTRFAAVWEIQARAATKIAGHAFELLIFYGVETEAEYVFDRVDIEWILRKFLSERGIADLRRDLSTEGSWLNHVLAPRGTDAKSVFRRYLDGEITDVTTVTHPGPAGNEMKVVISPPSAETRAAKALALSFTTP